MAERRTNMPMSSAGILGMGSNMELSGLKISPYVLVGIGALFILVVHVASRLQG
jgi:preprotein translocase subunit Sec61beta